MHLNENLNQCNTIAITQFFYDMYSITMQIILKAFNLEMKKYFSLYFLALNVTKYSFYSVYHNIMHKRQIKCYTLDIQQAKADYCHTDQTTFAYKNIVLSAFYSL